MNDIALTVLILSIIAVIAIVAVLRIRANKKAKQEQATDALPIKLPTSFPYFYDTPLGAGVACEQPLAEREKVLVLNAIDDGISQMLRSTIDKGFVNYRRHSDFYYCLITPTAVSSEGYPSLVTKGGLLAAEVTLGLEEAFSLVMVLPQQSSHLDYLTAGARHGAEHIAAFFNDREFYEQSKRPGHHSHPFYP